MEKEIIAKLVKCAARLMLLTLASTLIGSEVRESSKDTVEVSAQLIRFIRNRIQLKKDEVPSGQ